MWMKPSVYLFVMKPSVYLLFEEGIFGVFLFFIFWFDALLLSFLCYCFVYCVEMVCRPTNDMIYFLDPPHVVNL